VNTFEGGHDHDRSHEQGHDRGHDREDLHRADEPRHRHVQRRVADSRSTSAAVPRTVASDARGFAAAVNVGIWPVQLAGGGAREDVDVHAAAARGTEGSGGALPHHDAIQRAFGHHDISDVRAYVGGGASDAAAAIGAEAFATGNRVAFAQAPDLGLAAHEAAHVVQQRGGVHLSGGVGHAGDVYEQHADAVADQVVRGGSAEQLLDTMAPGGESRTPSTALQRREIRVTVVAEAARTLREAIGRASPAEAAQIATQLHAVRAGNGSLSFRVGADHYTVTVAAHDAAELATVADAAAAARGSAAAPSASPSPAPSGSASPAPSSTSSPAPTPAPSTAAAPHVTAELRRVGRGGAGGEVAPVEYVSASGSGHTTTSIIMDRIVQLMHAQPTLRFVDAARAVVRGHLTHDEPVASARVGAPADIVAEPTVRYALVIAEVNYPGTEDDLDDVAARTHAGAPARRVIEGDYGRDHTRVARDVTRDQMIAEIRAGIDRAAGELHDGQQGELMVNFQGHGGTFGPQAVDDGVLLPGDMVRLSAYAVGRRVHLVIVSDGCYGGTMTAVAQGLANEHLAARVDQTAASGGLPPATATALHQQLEQLHRDLQVALRLGVQLEDLDGSNPTEIEHAVGELRDWLRVFGPVATTGLPLLSGDVSRQLHDCWQQLVVDHVPVHTHDQVRTWRLRLDHLVSQIGAEVSAAQEEIAMTLDLSGL